MPLHSIHKLKWTADILTLISQSVREKGSIGQINQSMTLQFGANTSFITYFNPEQKEVVTDIKMLALLSELALQINSHVKWG